MRIRLARQSDRAAWNAYLDRSGSRPPLNMYEWKDILEATYRVKTYFFVASDENGGIRGILPAYVTRSAPGKRKLFSLRFGCVGEDNDTRNRLISHAKGACLKNGIAFYSVTSGYDRIDTDLCETAKKTVFMKLPDTHEEAWKGLRDKTRNMIRKAAKSGITAERGFRYLKDFYNIYAANMVDKGVPIHSFAFFRNVAEKIGDRAELIVAKNSGCVIGGILVLFSRSTAIYPFQASLRGFWKSAPNDLLVWETIKSCIQREVYRLDMGESAEGGGTFKFKTNFGGRPRDIFYYTAGSDDKSRRQRNTARNRSIASVRDNLLSRLPFSLKKNVGLWRKKRGRII